MQDRVARSLFLVKRLSITQLAPRNKDKLHRLVRTYQ